MKMSLEDDVLQLFERLARDSGEEYASLEVSRGVLGSGPKGAPEFGMSLKPTNPDAAPVHVVIFGNTDLVVTAGYGTVFEYDGCGKPERRERCLSEIGDLCRAVIDGSFEETVWFVRAKDGQTPENVSATRSRLKIRDAVIRKSKELRPLRSSA
jgi:hypothetical protein